MVLTVFALEGQTMEAEQRWRVTDATLQLLCKLRDSLAGWVLHDPCGKCVCVRALKQGESSGGSGADETKQDGSL